MLRKIFPVLTVLLVFLMTERSVMTAPTASKDSSSSTPYTLAGSYRLLDMTMGAYDTLALYDFSSPWVKDQFGGTVDQLWGGSVAIFNHEYFGHGYRAREYGLKGYPLVTPWIGVFVVTSNIPNDDVEILLTGGGLESNFHAYRLYREKYFMNGTYNYLHFAELQRIIGYYYILIFTPFFGDPNMYSQEINKKYGIKNNKIPATKTYLGLLWMSLDPWNLPLIPFIGEKFQRGKYYKLGNSKFVYGTNYFMTPYGSEYDADLCFLIGKSYHQFTLRYGESPKYMFGGVDFTSQSPKVNYPAGSKRMFGGAGWRGRRIISLADTIFFGAELNGWYEPEYNNGRPEKRRKKGGSASLQSEILFGPTISLEGEGGYKTQGYLPGRGFKKEIFALFAFNSYSDVAR